MEAKNNVSGDQGQSKDLRHMNGGLSSKQDQQSGQQESSREVGSKGQQDMQSELDGLRQGIGKTLQSFLGHYPEAVHHAATYLDSVGHSWSAQRLEQIAGSCRGFMSGKNRGEPKTEIKQFIKSKPFQALCGALLLGTSAGLLFARSQND